jgi:RNA polymerase sigma factor (sigma-70 family)
MCFVRTIAPSPQSRDGHAYLETEQDEIARSFVNRGVIETLAGEPEREDVLGPLTFEGIYAQHHNDVLRYASLMLRNPDDGADVAAEAFAQAFDAWRSGRGPRGRALPWLLLITRRLLIDRWRRHMRIRWLRLGDGTEAAAPDQRSRREFWLWLDRLADALPERQREVIFLRYRRDLSDSEIGTVMGLSESGVRSLAARAIGALRDHPELSQ